MAKTIYLVQAFSSDGVSRPVKVFEAKTAAKLFIKECQAYCSQRPALPEDHSDERGHERWCRKHKAWERKHPAAPFSYHTDYEVVPIKLEAPHG